jgi:hypothetical protein
MIRSTSFLDGLTTRQHAAFFLFVDIHLITLGTRIVKILGFKEPATLWHMKLAIHLV